MRSYFSLEFFYKMGFCLVIILLLLVAFLYAQFIWQVIHQVTTTVNNSVSRADDYLLSLSK